jgi:hypothetical protein
MSMLAQLRDILVAPVQVYSVVGSPELTVMTLTCVTNVGRFDLAADLPMTNTAANGPGITLPLCPRENVSDP